MAFYCVLERIEEFHLRNPEWLSYFLPNRSHGMRQDEAFCLVRAVRHSGQRFFPDPAERSQYAIIAVYLASLLGDMCRSMCTTVACLILIDRIIISTDLAEVCIEMCLEYPCAIIQCCIQWQNAVAHEQLSGGWLTVHQV